LARFWCGCRDFADRNIPCNRTPPSFSFELMKLTSNILAVYIRKRKLGLLTPRQILRGFCLLACRPEALSGYPQWWALINTTQPC
jgi:hypothetical protein